MNKSTVNFWGIGAQKSGTSWLYHNLMSHEDFDLPPLKEFHYFDRHNKYKSPNKLNESYLHKRIIKKGYLSKSFSDIKNSLKSGNTKHLRFYIKWYFSKYNDEWYRSIFKIFMGIKGEITPSYSILDKEDILKMYKISPDAKLILLLRNPVDRAWSNFRHKNKHESLEDFTFEDIIKFIDSDEQESRSDYIRTIENFSSVFPANQILIGFYDAIIDKPNELLDQIVSFLSSNSKSTSDSIMTTNYNNTGKVFNKSRTYDIPQDVKDYLCKKYKNSISELSLRYGGYFNKWLFELYGMDDKKPYKSITPTFILKEYHKE